MVYTVDGVQYTRRKKIPITGAASGAQTNFQIKLTALWEASMQADYDDARFTKADMQTLIDAWLESKTDSTTADIWAEFPTTPADGIVKTEAYMYYGNAGAANYWDGDATFLEFDNDANVIANEWGTVGGTWDTVSDGGNTVRRRTNGAAVFGSDSTAGTITATSYTDFIIDTKVKHDSSAVDPYWTGIQFRYTDNSNRYYAYIENDGYVKLESSAGLLGSYSGSYAQNTWHDLSIKVFGTTIKVTVNGTERISVTDSDESTGKLGYFNYNLNTNELNNKYDNFRVRKYAANPPTYEFGTEEHQRRTPMMM